MLARGPHQAIVHSVSVSSSIPLHVVAQQRLPADCCPTPVANPSASDLSEEGDAESNSGEVQRLPVAETWEGRRVKHDTFPPNGCRLLV